MRSPQLEASMDKLFAATAQDGEKMRRVGIGEAQHQQVTHSHETPNPVQARIFEYDSGTTTKVTLASLSLMHLTALLLIPPQPKRGETVKVKPGENEIGAKPVVCTFPSSPRPWSRAGDLRQG
ncbi:hypothetical protein DTO166G4_6534 [Paecilomyces variotii]|nr:hypothetical protein DTO164E3_7959 [Paecilomyces variotii]KAJ9202366.1 hypothetical protein DTO032I3_3619 [Paecilomyces variotii]KAJ9211882.1 hypothetical protein DTO166G4_6534 [Paecilomyces variotii]KAJ9228274.1 hypothetical protein DTO166G5_8714 [Paecilomyces variotii]KAJ9248922.1 hypothetical protein DTO195F2_8669 [Paecilomyces variotii]